VAIATQRPHYAFLAGLATAIGAGMSMASSLATSPGNSRGGDAVPSDVTGMICLHIGRLWRLGVLRLSGGQVESLFDLGLPAEVAALDALLAGPGVLAPIEASWSAGAVGFGRPTVPMDRFVRLMIVKARSGWDYETLVREVSDSLHLRRFCRIGLWDRLGMQRAMGAVAASGFCRRRRSMSCGWGWCAGRARSARPPSARGSIARR
jgi:hypothetical protein